MKNHKHILKKCHNVIIRSTYVSVYTNISLKNKLAFHQFFYRFENNKILSENSRSTMIQFFRVLFTQGNSNLHCFSSQNRVV